MISAMLNLHHLEE